MEKRNEQIGNIKNTFLLLGLISIVTITFLATSYGLLAVSEEANDIQTVRVGEFNIDYSDGSAISLDNAKPVLDEEGMKSKSYDFTISNTGDVSANYLIRLEEDQTIDTNKRLTASQIKYSLKEEDGNWSKPALLSTLPNFILIQNKTLKNGNKINYNIKLWIDENVGNEGKNKEYKSRIVVEAVQDNLNFAKKIDQAPIINLKGNKNINILQGETFVDEGIDNITDDSKTINIEQAKMTYEFYDGEKNIEVQNIDTSKIGVYYIKYEITDDSGNTTIAVRTVNVHKKDIIPPTINLNGSSIVYVNQDEEYEELGAVAEDSNSNDLTKNIVTLGNVNTKQDGEYLIKYIVTDNENNIASVARTVIVSSNEVVTVKLIKGAKVSSIGSNDTLTCSKDVGANSCDITLPTIDAENGYIGYWSTYEKATSGELPGATISVNESKTYYALTYRKVMVTYEKTAGVESIAKEKDSCIINQGKDSCSIILPLIKEQPGYDNKFFTTDKDSTNGTREKRTIKINNDTTYYAKATDDTNPICHIKSITPTNINVDDEIVVKVDCTDTSKSISKDLSEEDLEILVDTTKVTPKIKRLITTKAITNGKEYTFSLKGFSVKGTLSFKLKENAVRDKSENGNLSTIMTTNVNIK